MVDLTMQRHAAILTVAVLLAVALFFAQGRTRTREMPTLPPHTEDATEGVVAADPGHLAASGPADRPEQETRTPSGVHTAEPLVQLPTELVVIDGSTGRIVRTVLLTFIRRIDPAADQVPAPFVAAGDSFEFKGPLSIFAERVRLTAVVWPELDLTVQVEEADGTPAHDAVVTQVRQGGEHRSFVAKRIGLN